MQLFPCLILAKGFLRLYKRFSVAVLCGCFERVSLELKLATAAAFLLTFTGFLLGMSNTWRL